MRDGSDYPQPQTGGAQPRMKIWKLSEGQSRFRTSGGAAAKEKHVSKVVEHA